MVPIASAGTVDDPSRSRAEVDTSLVKPPEPTIDPRLKALCSILDGQKGRYKELRKVSNFGEYVKAKGDRADEELLTEPILGRIIQDVLGFPEDAYFPQLGKSGSKPDFTPIDLIAHRFVLDAKATDSPLGTVEEQQIRRYIDQRSLDFGILFNLRELRVYRRNTTGRDTARSFSFLPLWQYARGEAFEPPELPVFIDFCETFGYRSMGTAEKIAHVRAQEPWRLRLTAGDSVEVDIEFLVRRLHDLSTELAGDADAEADELKRQTALNPDRQHKLIEELRVLALDLSPGADTDDMPDSIDGWRDDGGLAGRVWRQYLLRVAYLALVRIMLYRSWEDSGFVDDVLSDGGFGDTYDRLKHGLGDVLDEAFTRGAKRYHWLYGPDNNYDWYRPRDEALIDVLYSLAPVPLGRLDADVLGALYQSYVEEIDRDRLGQFFTPRSVVKFMLDRAGFQGADGVFRLAGDERSPKRLLDFATGSGGFLVEAARRIIDEAGVDHGNRRDLDDALNGIVNGLVGVEISPFPYYLTEVNLLLQVSRVLGELAADGQRPPNFVLRVLHADTLAAKSTPEASLAVPAALRGDTGEIEPDDRYDLVPLDGQKQLSYRELKADGGFDFVVGNPPYVSEANNKPLFDRLRQIAAWKGILRGKTDYLYYFLWLAIEKLAPGGRLAVIVPAGWMNAGQADFLREKLAAELTLEELFLFGSYKLFAPEHGIAPTPTVESAILIATKGAPPKGHKLRVVALEDEKKAGDPSRDELLEGMLRRIASPRGGRKGGIFVHSVAQSDLNADQPWPVKHGAADVPTLVVRHLNKQLQRGEPFENLERSWKVFRGIETAADAYTSRIQKRLSATEQGQLARQGHMLGEPIYELPAGSESHVPWRDHPELLAKTPESTAILYAAVDGANYANLLRLTASSPPPPAVLDILETWRPLLESRAGFAEFPNRPWWETHRPRTLSDLVAPKVMSLYRTDRGRFALDESGDWQPSNKLTAAVGREKNAPVAYLCGILNSELLDLWYAVRGKTPRDVWRNYEPKRMNEIPYRRADGDPRADEIARLVRSIAANRTALLPHRGVSPELGRLVKDPWKIGPFTLSPSALIGEMAKKDTVTVRLDPELVLQLGESTLGRPERVDDAIVFRYKREETGRISGPPERLDLLEQLLDSGDGSDPRRMMLPRDVAAFEAATGRRRDDVQSLLDEGRELVEQVERLVCALYDVSDELTEAVIDHAVHRAAPKE
jgi:hypothetical protein